MVSNQHLQKVVTAILQNTDEFATKTSPVLPAAPVAESSCQTTDDSKVYRGCFQDQPQNPKSSGRLRQPLDWL
jgi:hypothetical protein